MDLEKLSKTVSIKGGGYEVKHTHHMPDGKTDVTGSFHRKGNPFSLSPKTGTNTYGVHVSHQANNASNVYVDAKTNSKKVSEVKAGIKLHF